MAKEKFDRTKPHVNVGTIGHIDHGKTTLTAALTKVAADKGWAKFVPYDEVAKASRVAGPARRHEDSDDRVEPRRVCDGEPALRARGLPGPRGLHQEHDHGRGADGRRDPGGVSATDGPMPQTREHVLLARQVNVPYLVVALNKVDAVDDPELLDLVELEVRELLTSYGFQGDDVPVVRVSALEGAAGRRGGRGERDQADGSARQLHSAAGARDRQAVHDADRRRVLDLGPRHGGDRAHRARAR